MGSRYSPAERYRHEAARIRREVKWVRDGDVHQKLLDVARQYEELAVAAEPPPRLGLGRSNQISN
jgi:hypothetical protein